MIQAAYFWFVPANLRPYSAMVAMAPADAEDMDCPDREIWWAALANRSVRELRRKGMPGSIAGRSCDAFPSGIVRLDRDANTAEIHLDEAIAGQDYLFWVIAEFALNGMELTVLPAPRGPVRESVGAPKPWY